MQPVIQLEEVRKSYGSHVAVDNLSLTVPDGSLYGFIGPNGSGKTTTIRMILRIIHPDSGRITVLGAAAAAAANDLVGYLPEERGLYKKLSVSRMLGYYAALKGMRRDDAKQQIRYWLDRFELSNWSAKRIDTLSKGMSQKVQFVASIISRPRIVILDEPFSGLDPVNAEIIRNTVLELRNSGTTVIFSTHDVSVAEKMCDYIFMIYKGQKVLDGTLPEIKSQYGADSIRLRWDGPRHVLEKLPEVHRASDLGGYQEIQFHGDPQKLLHVLLANGAIHLFEISQPSLHDIFIRIAGESLNGPQRKKMVSELTASSGDLA
ncbi:MAG: ATP-binding cassette domain-containing protein [Planctomycetales bacterium]|nr:ATP-binding cassette domain-containing protein [Planctomycetales bacterium]